MRERGSGESEDAVRRGVEDYLDLRYLKYFRVVAESGSFTRAAERLNTVQPSISRQIKRLEEIVGTPLFLRGPHDVTLTAAGEVFLAEAKQLLAQARRAIGLAQDSANAAAGRLSVGVVPGVEPLFFEHVLKTVRRDLPDIQVAVWSLAEREQLERLRAGSLDIAFLSGPVEAPDLTSTPAVRLPFFVVLPAQHPLAGREKVALSDLGDLAFICPDADYAPYYHAAVARVAAAAGVKLRPTETTCESPLSALQMVAAAAGFCFIVDTQTAYAPPGTVVRPIDADPPPTTTLHLVCQRQQLNGRRRRFVDAFRAGQAEGEV